MSVTKITDDNIESLDASKLIGAMPAIDGSALTGISVDQELLALRTNIRRVLMILIVYRLFIIQQGIFTVLLSV